MSNTIWWPSFCGNGSLYDAFWSEELTINTFTPDLTNCFQNTICIWVPSIFLFIGGAFYSAYIHRNAPETPERGFSAIGLTQLAGLILLVLVSLCDLVFLLVKDRAASIQPVAYTAAVISLLTYIFALFLHSISCRGGYYNTGVAFVFWFASLITGTIILRSRILQHEDSDVFLFVTTVLRFILILLQFFSTFIPDKGNVTKTPKSENTPLLNQQRDVENSYHSNEEQQLANPTLTRTFPSRALLFWFTHMVAKGYKGDIKLADIWRLTKYNTSQEIYTKFSEHWASGAKSKQIKFSQLQSSCHKSRDFTTQSVRENHTWSSATSLCKDVSTGKPDSNSSQQGGGYLLFKALFRTFALDMVPGGVLIFLYYGCLLLNPSLLQAVITFVDSDDPYTWKGFALAAAMFFLAFLNPIFFQNHLLITLTVGMRIRGALTATIYRKALKLSAIAKRTTTTGKIVNLMSIDVQKIQDTVSFLHEGWVVIFLVFFSIYFLWQLLGPSCLVGVVFLLGVLPAHSQFVARTVMSLQRENMTLKDERIKIMSQVLSGIKVLKLYAWEPYFESRIKDLRRKETDNMFRFWLVVALANTLFICTPFIVAVLCFTTYVLSDPDNILTAQVAFVSLSYLNILSLPMYFMPFVLMQCAQAVISIKRIGKFLLADEVNPDNVSSDPDPEFAIRVIDATFSWGEQYRSLLSGINMSITRGTLVAVVGEVGSGKSSLLSALLGDMVKEKGTVNIADKKVYVPQQAWIQNLTVRGNILFGLELEEERYYKILELCALEPDLELLPGGDMTEIGERGINLSGGQKQRVSMARAVYQNADIYLLDDPLSAVDAHLGKHIFDNVIGPQGCLHDKTRIFVTNQIQYLKHTDDVIVMVDGAISERGSYKQLLNNKGAFAQFVQTHLNDQLVRSTDEEGTHSNDIRGDLKSDASNRNNANLPYRSFLRKRKHSRGHTFNDKFMTKDERHKMKRKEALVEEETMEKGSIDIAVLKWYIKASSYTTLLITLLGLLCFVCAQSSTNIWLSAWTNDASAGINGTVTSQDVRLGVYGCLGALQVISTSIFNVALAVGFVRAAKILHNTLLSNVFRCPMSFFDTTPIGRIINRFSKDVDIMDKNLPQAVGDSLMSGAPLLSTFVVIIYSVPLFTVVVLAVLIVFVIIQRVYTSCARQLKRLDSITRSPIYNFFSETLNGVTSIRAYGCQRRFIDFNDKQLDQSQIRGRFGVLFTVMFAILQRDSLSAGLAGLAVTYSLQVGIDLTLFLRVTCEMETYFVAVERIKEYAEQQTEAAWRLAGITSSVVWPEQGVVSFSEYSTRYRSGLDLVLNNITFTITAQEKVAIVGRTGAGKSTLALALFRLLEASSGRIVIDDLNIAVCGLHDVRSKLTIIPHDPVLFSGSLCFNLDPSGERSDEELWNALEHAHLKPFVLNLPKQLQYECGEDGDNLSVGQKQLVCLARALLRKSKVLVLDEATASVDVDTDSLIQTTIQQEFKHCTVITVAHRLNTILDYDRIMVMDGGHIAEFDTPQQLISDSCSLFYSMVKDAGLV